jgi:hypothetical protein
MEQTARVTKKCRYCCSDMPLAAKVCLQCKYYQSTIRNQLTLLAGFGGLIALLTYFTSSFLEIRKTLYWVDDLRLISVDPYGGYVMQNTGDGDLFIDGVHFEGLVDGQHFSGGTIISESIGPGRITIHKPAHTPLIGGIVEAGVNPKIPNFTMALEMSKVATECVEANLYSTNSVSYKTLTQHLGKRLLQMPIRPKIVFYSRNAIPIEKEFDGAILFVENNKKKECWQ